MRKKNFDYVLNSIRMSLRQFNSIFKLLINNNIEKIYKICCKRYSKKIMSNTIA